VPTLLVVYKNGPLCLQRLVLTPSAWHRGRCAAAVSVMGIVSFVWMCGLAGAQLCTTPSCLLLHVRPGCMHTLLSGLGFARRPVCTSKIILCCGTPRLGIWMVRSGPCTRAESGCGLLASACGTRMFISLLPCRAPRNEVCHLMVMGEYLSEAWRGRWQSIIIGMRWRQQAR
jgi:hypothetical protein